MTIDKKVGIMGLLVLGLLFVLLGGQNVRANPSYFLYNSTNSVTSLQQTATTSVAFISSGRGTTTVALNGGLGSSQALDSAKLVVYRNATAVTSATKIEFEFSPNCSATYVEWFANKLDWGGGTTTPNLLGTTGTNAYVWAYATTTVGGVAETSNANSVDKITIDVPTPTNCVRAVLTTPLGAASSSVWGMLIGKRQAP